MIYRNRNLFCMGLTVFLGASFCIAQEPANRELEQAYEQFDATIGLQNTEIFTGVEYIEEHRMINEKHKFYGSNDFVPITVIYEGQPYFNIPSKYNIFNDVLLVKLPSQRGETDFKLLETGLDGFLINSKKFVNVYEAGSEFSGIYELLYDSNNMRLLKKHTRSYKMISSRNLVHYEFKERSPEYFFGYGDEIYELSRRNLFELFPDHKDEVREHYKNYRRQKKDKRDSAVVSMFQKLSKLSNKNKA